MLKSTTWGWFLEFCLVLARSLGILGCSTESLEGSRSIFRFWPSRFLFWESFIFSAQPTPRWSCPRNECGNGEEEWFSWSRSLISPLDDSLAENSASCETGSCFARQSLSSSWLGKRFSDFFFARGWLNRCAQALFGLMLVSSSAKWYDLAFSLGTKGLEGTWNNAVLYGKDKSRQKTWQRAIIGVIDGLSVQFLPRSSVNLIWPVTFRAANFTPGEVCSICEPPCQQTWEEGPLIAVIQGWQGGFDVPIFYSSTVGLTGYLLHHLKT